MDETTKKILEIVTEIQADISNFRKEVKDEFREVRAEIADMRRDLEYLKEKVVGMEGYAKEIDMLMTRMAVVEKHVGISK